MKTFLEGSSCTEKYNNYNTNLSECGLWVHTNLAALLLMHEFAVVFCALRSQVRTGMESESRGPVHRPQGSPPQAGIHSTEVLPVV